MPPDLRCPSQQQQEPHANHDDDQQYPGLPLGTHLVSSVTFEGPVDGHGARRSAGVTCTARRRAALRGLAAEYDSNEIAEQATGEHAHEELDRW